jgi:hypothetical protein
MLVEILAHDTVSAIADIRFTHNDIVHEETYELVHVIPGTVKTLKDTNSEFTKDMQLKVIDTLTGWVQNMIESGAYSPKLEGNPAPSHRAPTVNR